MGKMDKRGMMKQAIQVAWPAVLESFFVCLAGMIDTMMVSAMGASAVAAVGLTTQPKFIGLAPFLAINIAVSAIVARRKGEERRRSANETLATACVLVLACCMIVTAVSLLFAEPLMVLSGSNADTHAYAVIYFRIIMGGTIFNVISLVINAAQRGSGNTRIAMTTNVVSSLVNICFNYLLIGGNFGFPRMGITGAALATVLGTVVACLMSIRSLFRKESYVSVPWSLAERVRPTRTDAGSIVHFGSNLLAENLAMRVGFLVTALVAARLGTEEFAAHNVGMNLLGLGFSFGDGMQVAAVALSGQALGAGRKDQAREYGAICQRIGVVISLVLSFLLLVGGKAFFRLYFTDESILDIGVMISRFTTVIFFLQISQIIYGGCLRGGGDVHYTLMASLISVTLIRSVVTLVLVVWLHTGLVGVWGGILSDQLSRFLILRRRFRQGKWVDMQV